MRTNKRPAAAKSIVHSLAGVDWSGAFLELVVGRVSPRARARLAWLLAERERDPTPRLLDALVEPGTVVVDIGASWGLFAYRMARLVGSGGRVHAFEPNPVNARSLAAMSGAGADWTIHQQALSDEPGKGELRVPRRHGRQVNAMGSLSVPARRAELYTDAITVEVCRLDDALGDDARRVGFLKCDVEGHELSVLRGANQVLSDSRPAILIEIEQRHQEEDVDRTFEFLARLGYDGYFLRPTGLRPIAEFDVRRDQLAFLDEGELQPAVPSGYVHDFVFVPAGAHVAGVTWD